MSGKEEETMTPIDWIIIGVLAFNFIVGTVGGAIWKTQREKVKNELLKEFIDRVVRSADEMDLSDQLGMNKQEWVVDRIVEQYPQFAKNSDKLDILVNAAVQAAGLGATEKKTKGLLPEKSKGNRRRF